MTDVEMPAPRLSVLPDRPLTVDDLDLLPDDGRRYELIDGSLLVSPPPTAWHQLAASRVYDLLRASETGPWVTLVGGAGIVLRNNRVLIPDVLVVSRNAVAPQAKHFQPTEVSLVVEVVSPSSTATDSVLKRSLYESHGIDNYWIVEPLPSGEPVVTVLRLHEGRYQQTVVASRDALPVDVPFPMTIRPRALLQ